MKTPLLLPTKKDQNIDEFSLEKTVLFDFGSKYQWHVKGDRQRNTLYYNDLIARKWYPQHDKAIRHI